MSQNTHFFGVILCLKKSCQGNFLTNFMYDITYPYRKHIPATTSIVISVQTTLILPRDETFIHLSYTLYTIYKCISLMIKSWKLQRLIVDLFHSFIVATHFSRAFRGRQDLERFTCKRILRLTWYRGQSNFILGYQSCSQLKRQSHFVTTLQLHLVFLTLFSVFFLSNFNIFVFAQHKHNGKDEHHLNPRG